ncbi:FlgO family outer membrane protein [uncultured Pseudodesulfovibrio sp.]|uniref:FlgO family outer membrane protein n=1 Tax=uncultured Pseudodesulfovibrio sp. TaxID=2035858 RepID=UPI0029C79807|nr:FlgO family outer membrane protein [uncultured Pseudodesulfovibrio sp.]
MNKAALSILTAILLLSLQGCGNRMWEDTKKTTSDTFDYVFDTTPTARSYHDTASVPIIELNDRAADVLFSNVASDELTIHSAVFTAPFTNQNDPGDKSVFGRTMAQQVADRLVQHGVRITEGTPNATDFTYAAGVSAEDYTKAAGLAGSSRELPPRSAKLVGSYVIADRYVYMTARVVRLVDSTVVSAHNWTLPITDSVREMLPQLNAKDEGLVPTVKTSFND